MSHADDVAVAESARQQAHKAAVNEAGHVAADAAYRQALITAGRKWSVKNGAMAAVLQKGEALPGGSVQPGEM